MIPGQEYEVFMREAISLAQKGSLNTYPNPAVGAVLVVNGNIVARGWHRAAGEPHAEVDCLCEARNHGVECKGATMVVTLEPCSHQGKTPPCVNALIDAGISTLVYGCKDPTEHGGGAEILSRANIKVIGSVLEQECFDLIADFYIWNTTNRPYIILKLASTLDGYIATRTGDSRWISCERSRVLTHELRAAVGKHGGTILIGGETFRKDNPSLTARNPLHASDHQPLACILTSRLPKIDPEINLLRDRPEQTIFFASPAASASTSANALRNIGCRVYAIEPGHNKKPDFPLMLSKMRQELGCPYVLCEGGGQLALSLLEDGLIDEFHLHLAPIIVGDNDAKPLFHGRTPLNIEEALGMRFCATSLCDRDVHLLLRPAQEK